MSLLRLIMSHAIIIGILPTIAIFRDVQQSDYTNYPELANIGVIVQMNQILHPSNPPSVRRTGTAWVDHLQILHTNMHVFKEPTVFSDPFLDYIWPKKTLSSNGIEIKIRSPLTSKNFEKKMNDLKREWSTVPDNFLYIPSNA
eukprot:77943_1